MKCGGSIDGEEKEPWMQELDGLLFRIGGRDDHIEWVEYHTNCAGNTEPRPVTLVGRKFVLTRSVPDADS